MLFYGETSEENQNSPPQNMPFRHKNYFRLITLKKNVDTIEALKTKNMLPFVKYIYICKENLHLLGCLPLH